MNLRLITGLSAGLAAGVLLADINLFIPVSERAKRADVVAIVSLSQFTESNCHARVVRVLKGKCSGEVTLPIRNESDIGCAMFSLRGSPSNTIVFLTLVGSRLKLTEGAPAIDYQPEAVRIIEMAIQEQGTNSPNKTVEPTRAPSGARGSP